MRETSVEKRLTNEVKKAGGICFKVLPVIAGLPDRCVLLPVNKVYFVETKAPGGNLRPSQVALHRKMARVGVQVTVLSSVDEVANWIKEVV